MKKCDYCGMQNEDATIACGSCGTPFADKSAPDKQSEAFFTAEQLEAMPGRLFRIEKRLRMRKVGIRALGWVTTTVGVTIAVQLVHGFPPHIRFLYVLVVVVMLLFICSPLTTCSAILFQESEVRLFRGQREMWCIPKSSVKKVTYAKHAVILRFTLDNTHKVAIISEDGFPGRTWREVIDCFRSHVHGEHEPVASYEG